jgi:hypothetical protein
VVADLDLLLRRMDRAGDAGRGVDDDFPARGVAGLGQGERERLAVRVEQQQEAGVGDLPAASDLA